VAQRCIDTGRESHRRCRATSAPATKTIAATARAAHRCSPRDEDGNRQGNQTAPDKPSEYTGSGRPDAATDHVAETAATLGRWMTALVQHLAHPEPLDRRGRRLPETLARIEQRDDLIVEAAEKFFPGLSASAAAEALRRALARYADCAWRRDAATPRCPDRHRGRIEGACWEILSVHARVPATRTIRLALGKTIRCQREGR
jgi:hypothetical protein